ncbi:MAG: tetratricopeptide repeat protein [Campylobacterota bacterium]|nr:tetratricopeptide repeat protein [Campylobacterota bacterium]
MTHFLWLGLIQRGSEWYWQLGAFLSEYGSIELVGLGVGLLIILAFVEVNKDNGKENKKEASSPHNYFEKIINNGTINVVHNRSVHWTPLIILVFTVLLSAMPQVDASDPTTRQIETYHKEITSLNKKRLMASSLQEKIKIDKDIKELESKIVEIEEYRAILKTLSLKLAKEAQKIYQYQGIDAAILYLQGDKAQTQQKALDRRMKEFAQKFKLQAKLLIMQNRYDEARKAYKNMIRYDRSYESLYTYAHYLQRQNKHHEAIVIYSEILRLEQLLPKDRAMALQKVATIYYSHDNLTKALETYQEALEIRKTLHDKILIADTHNNMALIYEKQKNYHQAKQHYNEALVLESSLANNKPPLP